MVRSFFIQLASPLLYRDPQDGKERGCSMYIRLKMGRNLLGRIKHGRQPKI